jgi:beta-lactamase regulating signal transducer with metallopeptidase domain
MSTIAALRALFFAGECFFGGSLILLLAWLAARTTAAAAKRHLVWTAAFAALLALPVFALIVPPAFALALLPAAAPVAMPADMIALPKAAAVDAAPLITTADIVAALATVWVAGVVVFVLRLVAGWVGLLVLQRRSVRHIPEGIDGRKFADAPRWELRLRTAPGEAGALTWGVFKAIVLLPKSSVRWPRERLESVLLHEVAHVRRRDSLARLVAMIACALYWPNPFAWSAARAMRRDAEIAADDAVLTSGVRASAYAEHLLQLAARGEPRFAGVTLSMAEPSTLKERVQSVLSASGPRSGVTKMDVFKVAMLGVAVTAVFAVARPSLAEAHEDATVVAQPSDPAPLTQKVVHAEPDVETSPDVPVAPEAPPAPPSDALPPAPASDAIPPVPPAPALGALPPVPPVPPHAEFRREMQRHAVEMRKAREEIRRAEAEMRKAIADADIDGTVARALKDAEPGLAKARAMNAAAVQQALAKAHVSEQVAAAMRQASEQIRHAAEQMERRSRAAQEHSREHDEEDADAE